MMKKGIPPKGLPFVFYKGAFDLSTGYGFMR